MNSKLYPASAEFRNPSANSVKSSRAAKAPDATPVSQIMTTRGGANRA